MIRPLIKGLALTLRHFFQPSVTEPYPEKRWEPYPNYRGRQKLLVDDDGNIKCVACQLCATVCPAECIRVEPARDEEGRQYPVSYEIDFGRCIFCGFCVEACPVEALAMTTHYELAEYERTALVLDKEALLKDPKDT